MVDGVATASADSDTAAVAARVRLAARATTSPEMLCILAADPALTVRAAVALNPTYAAAADTQLAHDSDDRVRSLLAVKMARLLPGLSGADQLAAQTHVHGMLRLLADDAAVRVRAAIADTLMAVNEVPRDLILKLARDQAICVSDPIVRFSPLLTDADLLDLLATPPNAETAVAIASRAGLSAEVAHDIAQHADSAAVTALLSNRSATIQEATLDALIGQAGEHPEWHDPLVCRPFLPARSIRALSLIVAGHLLDVLINRADLPDDLAIELRGHVAQGLAEPQVPTEAEILDSVRRLNASGQLHEAALLDAASSGNARQTAAILAVASGVGLNIIDRAVALRSGKALLSLVSKAGFTMRAGAAVQSLIGRLGPDEILPAAPSGSFPLSADEMEWQVELLNQPSR